MRLSTGRRSRVCPEETMSACRSPFVPYQAHCLFLAEESVAPSAITLVYFSVATSDMLWRMWTSSDGTRIRQSQSNHAHRTCRTFTYMSSPNSCFIGMLLSPLAFAARSAVVLEVVLLSTSLPFGKNFLCTDTAHVARPHPQIRQRHLADAHDLVLAVVQFVHLPSLLYQILQSSQQFTLLPAVLLALSKLAIAGVVGFPLSLLVLLDLGVGHRLFLPDGFAQQIAVHVLQFQFHLMVIKDTIQFRCPLFGQLRAFVV